MSKAKELWTFSARSAMVPLDVEDEDGEPVVVRARNYRYEVDLSTDVGKAVSKALRQHPGNGTLFWVQEKEPEKKGANAAKA